MEIVFYFDTKGSSVAHSTNAPVYAVKAYDEGFYPIFTQRTAQELNAKLAPSVEVLESAKYASAFGWSAPIANEAVAFIKALLNREAM